MRSCRARILGSVTACTLAKYWSKFSSQVRTVPHGVVPPAQLFSIPRTRVPVGSSNVLRRSAPAAGPVSSIGVSPVILRFRACPGTIRGDLPPPDGSSTATSEPPWAASSVSTWFSVGASGFQSGNMISEFVYSWFDHNSVTSPCWGSSARKSQL
jgi:hypothetical protein